MNGTEMVLNLALYYESAPRCGAYDAVYFEFVYPLVPFDCPSSHSTKDTVRCPGIEPRFPPLALEHPHRLVPAALT